MSTFIDSNLSTNLERGIPRSMIVPGLKTPRRITGKDFGRKPKPYMMVWKGARVVE